MRFFRAWQTLRRSSGSSKPETGMRRSRRSGPEASGIRRAAASKNQSQYGKCCRKTQCNEKNSD